MLKTMFHLLKNPYVLYAFCLVRYYGLLEENYIYLSSEVGGSISSNFYQYFIRALKLEVIFRRIFINILSEF